MLRTALIREPEIPEGYAQLAMAYGRKGDLAQADLASAQAAFARGDYQDRARACLAGQDPLRRRLARLGEGRRHRVLPAAQHRPRDPTSPKGSISCAFPIRLAVAALPARRRRRLGARAKHLRRAARRDREDHPRLPDKTSRGAAGGDRRAGKAAGGGRRREAQGGRQGQRRALFNSPRHVVVGNPQGDVTFVEFFDYNCGYCKRALEDMMALMKSRPASSRSC